MVVDATNCVSWIMGKANSLRFADPHQPIVYSQTDTQNFQSETQNEEKSTRRVKMWVAERHPDRQISVDWFRHLLLDSVFAIHRGSVSEAGATPIDENAYEAHFIQLKGKQIGQDSRHGNKYCRR